MLRILLTTALVACTSVACSPQQALDSDDQQNKSAYALAGRWSPDCERWYGFEFGSNNSARIEVNSNQIYISAHVSTSAANRYTISLDRPEDLGRGGAALDWSSFSTSAPIADVTLSSDRTGTVEWHGFFNSKNTRYEWVEEADFSQYGSGAIRIYKCAIEG